MAALAALGSVALGGAAAPGDPEPEPGPPRKDEPRSSFTGVDLPTKRPCLEANDAEGFMALYALEFAGKGLGKDVKEKCEGPLQAGLPDGVRLELLSTTATGVVTLALDAGYARYRGLISTAIELEPGHETKVGRILGWGKGRTLRLAGAGAKTVVMKIRPGPVSWLVLMASHDLNGPAITVEATALLGRGMCAWPTQGTEAIHSRETGKGRIVRDVFTPL